MRVGFADNMPEILSMVSRYVLTDYSSEIEHKPTKNNEMFPFSTNNEQSKKKERGLVSNQSERTVKHHRIEFKIFF